ncbi:uncharacterized protein N7443_000847 [Penicillium atrosanguineum]|uniref:Ankyrin repeat-containing domain protein n=1 Tax=Penicillium atrosanguineum TaxID=1132637 RepID=A0A9W9QFA6_9EURO|nr:uncharacterized protein N7443_000847 [Penicillium atrosanguineum]KAJ5313963.1 hypothetical protein N7443_000847 [Penicillium atrosanguineum]KAJ5331133.1 ankyrin repeat-containing domain protein [Penicillium atrosanguineum]
MLLDLCGPSFLAKSKHGRDQLLSVAIQEGHLDVLKLFISEGFENTRGRNHMLNVAINGAPSSLQCLIEAGFEVNSTHGYNFPLLAATSENQLEKVKLLLEAGADPNWEAFELSRLGEDPNDPLHTAASNGCREIAQCLLEGGARYHRDGIFDARGIARLACNGQERIAILIMDSIDFESELADSDDAMRGHWVTLAATVGDEPLVRRLLAIGSDIIDENEYCDSIEFPALTQAALHGQAAIVRILLDEVGKSNPESLANACFAAIEGAVQGNYLCILSDAFDRGGDDLIESRGYDMLSCAIERQNEDACDFLVENKVLDIGIRGDNPKRLLPKALKSGNYTLVLQILNQSQFSLFDFVDEPKGTAVLQLAARYGPVEGFERLLGLGVALDPQNTLCEIALVQAAEANHPHIIKHFLDSGYDVNAMYCARIGSIAPLLFHVSRGISRGNEPGDERAIATAQFLIDQGADVNACGPTSETALCEAVRRCRFDLAAMLLDQGADPLKGIERNKSALQRTIVSANLEYVRLLMDKLSIDDPRYRSFVRQIPSHISKWNVIPGSNIGRDSKHWSEVWDIDEGSDKEKNTKSHTEDETQSFIMEAPKDTEWWSRFHTIKELARYYWRTMYPAPE